ncbi:hypothetical protein [Massilia sp. KIM]|uniref:hypothetical protein n=1 Tax=Massilia sp. KIM TaxID=1955422 RepID=UPI0011817437|nr:hypothetical protein [Massilia sp. KIM]
MKQSTLLTCILVRAAIPLGIVIGLYVNAGAAPALPHAPLAAKPAQDGGHTADAQAPQGQRS